MAKGGTGRAGRIHAVPLTLGTPLDPRYTLSDAEREELVALTHVLHTINPDWSLLKADGEARKRLGLTDDGARRAGRP